MHIHLVFIKRIDELVLDECYLTKALADKRQSELVDRQTNARKLAVRCEKCPMKKMNRSKFLKKKDEVIKYCDQILTDDSESHNIKCLNQVFLDYEYFAECYFVLSQKVIE